MALCLPLGAGHLLNRHLSSVMYPSGPRTLAGEALIRLRTVHGVIFVVEMAVGQLWRFVLDGWGVTGLGLAAAVFVIFRRRSGTRCGSWPRSRPGWRWSPRSPRPPRCPRPSRRPGPPGATWTAWWSSFFLVGAAVLLRAAPRRC